MTISIDKAFLSNTLTDLVRINSINPSLVPNSPGEAEIAAYLSNTMRNLGLKVSTYEPEQGRISVLGHLQGQGGGRNLMLNAHIDTVGIDGMENPFSASIKDGNLYGRGAYDMKGSLAACLAAIKALTEAKVSLNGDILIAAVADEEYASLGTADLIKQCQINKLPIDGAIVTEPTHLEICLAHKGFMWLTVETHGRAAHGSRFDLGIDANLRMGRFLAELDILEQALRNRQKHPLVGSPSLHAATLKGGTGLSTYANKCTLQIERRTIPGETEAQVIDELQSIINRLNIADPSFQASLSLFFTRPPFEVSPQAHLVQTLTAASTAVLGKQPTYQGQNPWMDSALLAQAGIETVVIGPTGAGAHAAEEWVEIESIISLAQILAETALNYCK